MVSNMVGYVNGQYNPTLWNQQNNTYGTDNNMANAYSNPQFQQIAQAQENIGQQNLQNQYGQAQTGAMQNMANRFGGLNTSIYNDTMAQNNRNMALAQSDLANRYTAQLGGLQNQYAQQGFQQQGLQNQGAGIQNQYKLGMQPYINQSYNDLQNYVNNFDRNQLGYNGI